MNEIEIVNGTFDFSNALALVKLGTKVKRLGWNGEDMFIFLVPGSKFVVNRAPLLGIFEEGTEVEYKAHIDMKMSDGTIGVWSPCSADLIESDWTVV